MPHRDRVANISVEEKRFMRSPPIVRAVVMIDPGGYSWMIFSAFHRDKLSAIA
jgi:hypothetical protein